VDLVIQWVNALFLVYTICILIRILMSWVTIAPMRRWSRAVVEFLHDTTNWYLNIFRRFIPAVGPLDLSPIVALLVLGIVNRFVIEILAGLA
jgi:YggT family protein